MENRPGFFRHAMEQLGNTVVNHVEEGAEKPRNLKERIATFFYPISARTESLKESLPGNAARIALFASETWKNKEFLTLNPFKLVPRLAKRFVKATLIDLGYDVADKAIDTIGAASQWTKDTVGKATETVKSGVQTVFDKFPGGGRSTVEAPGVA